jgi:hypothetical protein
LATRVFILEEFYKLHTGTSWAWHYCITHFTPDESRYMHWILQTYSHSVNLSIVIMMVFVIAVAITTALSTPTSCQPRYENPLGLILPHTHLTLVTLVDDIPQPCLDPCPISRVHRQGWVWQAAESFLDTSAFRVCFFLLSASIQMRFHTCNIFSNYASPPPCSRQAHGPKRGRRRGRGSAQDGDA